ncbi:MDR/zinc-dependent alcohol dehydrogenase-like family protein [Streptomyces mirabilis]|uniref:hypothetical protein n=1 Tax=Streptomyces mirabilis TaxID=68239 RepID=UPI003696C207
MNERLERASAHDVTYLDLRRHEKHLGETVRELTGGRGTNAVIDAVGMEAHGNPVTKATQWATGLLPDALAQPFMEKACLDRLGALYAAIDLVRRGGTVSLSGVYGGAMAPLPEWARRTCGAGCRRSCRCSPTGTPSAWTVSPPTTCLWRRRSRSEGAGGEGEWLSGDQLLSRPHLRRGR